MIQDRLSAEDWVHAGLQALVRTGSVGLKADVLARTLGVSRGSFYWHFANLDAYRRAVAARWQAIATDAVIGELERVAQGDRLRHLLRLAFEADWRLELAMRAWASAEDHVRPVVEAVDARRIAFIVKLLVAAGIGRKVAETRARVMYWAYLGRVLSRAEIGAAELRRLVDELVGLADAAAR